MDVTRWSRQIDIAVAKAAKGKPHQIREDLKQDCYVAVLEALDYLEKIADKEEADSAAYTVAYNRAINVLKKKSVLNDVVSLDFLKDTPNLEFSSSPTELELDAAINELPEPERFVIRELYFRKRTSENESERTSEREVAARVGRSREWVRNRKASAIELLRDYFEKR